MTKKQIVDELERYSILVPSRKNFERMRKDELLELLNYWKEVRKERERRWGAK